MKPIQRTLVLTLLAWVGASAAGPQPQAPTDEQRARAARKTATTHPHCSTDILKSFYYEIGDVNGIRTSGRVGGRISATSMMNVGSASKWLYAAYVVETQGLQPDTIPFLNFTSGYSQFDSTTCPDNGTLGDCPAGPRNEDEATAGIFHYDGGHMQQHAILIGLGPLKNLGLAQAIRSAVGSQLDIRYTKPQPPGGAQTNAVNYAAFLRRLLVGHPEPLALGPLLGTHAVCTIPGPDCVASSNTALPEAWHYSLGHWVEDDPVTTPAFNRAYSSPGLFGFYPWVDTDRKLYGILARNGLDVANEPYKSARCGRLIRQAWKSAIAQVD